MPVHNVRVETSKISTGVPIETVLSNTLSGLTTALDGEANDRHIREPVDPTNTERLDEPYRAGAWYFPEEDYDADTLLDIFETALRGTSKWYRIRYCLSDHDLPSEERTGDSWDESKTRTGGPVPSELA